MICDTDAYSALATRRNEQTFQRSFSVGTCMVELSLNMVFLMRILFYGRIGLIFWKLKTGWNIILLK